ncbi:gfo/Idh/MocA family oxidoreductase [bacterium]|nr:MAG: gfo/Idh/MocA family oxidoreductase [bacterium]
MLKIGIIGSGFGQYSLFPAFRSVKNCEVIAICGQKREQLVKYCESIDFNNIYADWRLLLKNEELDAVAIAVTPRAQYEIAKAAINKGLHVFAEKPLAVNVRQARELLSLARKKKIVHGVDFIFPEIAEWKKVKELLDKRTFGKLEHISVNWDFLGYDIKNNKSSWKTSVANGGGALSFFFSHGLYYLEHFAGEISRVKSLFTYSKESKNDGEVGADMLLRFKNGITGYAHVNCNYRGPVSHQLKFRCENGVIVLEGEGSAISNFIVRTYSQDKEKQLVIKKDPDRKNEDERVKIVRKLADRFVSSCLRGKQMYPSFREGLRVQELIEKIRAGKM